MRLLLRLAADLRNIFVCCLPTDPFITKTYRDVFSCKKLKFHQKEKRYF